MDDQIEEARQLAIDGWVEVFGWVEDRFGPLRGMNDVMDQMPTGFASAPSWLIDGVLAKLHVTAHGDVRLI